MVYIFITEEKDVIILDCHRGSRDGEYFRLVIDKTTQELIEYPNGADMDVSTAYSCIYKYLKNGKPLPKEEVAAWG